MKKDVVLASIFVFMTLPAAGVAAEAVSQRGAGDQRAACDAQCRENYQNNSAAMQACLRNCGAVGPASPAGAMAPAHEAAHTVQQAGAVTPPPTPAETSNLNLSKSNINRVAPPSGAGTQPVEAPSVKSSKSNSSDRQASPDTDETPRAEPAGDPPADG